MFQAGTIECKRVELQNASPKLLSYSEGPEFPEGWGMWTSGM